MLFLKTDCQKQELRRRFRGLSCMHTIGPPLNSLPTVGKPDLVLLFSKMCRGLGVGDNEEGLRVSGFSRSFPATQSSLHCSSEVCFSHSRLDSYSEATPPTAPPGTMKTSPQALEQPIRKHVAQAQDNLLKPLHPDANTPTHHGDVMQECRLSKTNNDMVGGEEGEGLRLGLAFCVVDIPQSGLLAQIISLR